MKSISVTHRVVLSTFYAAAMAYVESAVVVYLRLLVNGGTHLFPVRPLPPHLAHVELVREFATIVMLATVARLQSRRFRVNVAFFLFCFGVWDIFYYLWLKLLIGWPPSLLSWDILFLIPLPWFGPVLAPSLVSLMFIAGSLVILRFETVGKPIRFTSLDWIASFVGAALVIASFLWELPHVAKTGHPGAYPWWLFSSGAAVWVVMFTRRALLTRVEKLAKEERRSGESN